MSKAAIAAILAVVVFISGAPVVMDMIAERSNPQPTGATAWDKKPTDGFIRHGMSEIRDLIASAQSSLREGKLELEDAPRLANAVSDQVEHLTANSKLPADALAQFHAALAPIREGVAQLRANGMGGNAIVKISQALEAYGQSFDHPGWKPFTNSEKKP